MDGNVDWTIAELKKIETEENQLLIEATIALLKDQSVEIESLHGSMEGQLWSPSNWRK
ncbi:hypothetical protein ACE83Q_00830 [Dellaglioa sp. P0083]|uniref:hypothetical protein n=1 Tax=Dellaglioa kimchii TaxID=3344667 RepID=UPI0038D4EBED